MGFQEHLYEAVIYGLGRTLARYDPRATDLLIRDMGRNIRSYLEDLGYRIEPGETPLETVHNIVRFFEGQGFCRLEDAEVEDDVLHGVWRDLLGLRAYARIYQDAGPVEGAFISYPMNAIANDALERFDRALRYREGRFFPEEGWCETWEAIAVSDPRPAPVDLQLDVDRLLRVERETSRRLREVQGQLEATTDELRRQLANLEAFTFAAGHDLQEPLRTMSAFAELLALRYRDRLEGDALEFIEHIEDGARRMGDTIQALLGYAREDRREVSLETVDLGEVVRHVREDLDVAVREAAAEIEVDPLPVARADAVGLSNVFQNLITNALKFRGDQPPRIRIGAERLAAEWVITVSDNGIGVDAADRERIFGIFQRLHPVGRYGGVGLGLAISRKILERHGGRIWLEPGSEGGSRFRFTVPVERESA